MGTGLIVSLGGITFNTEVPDADGALWTCGEIVGWDSPPMRLQGLPPTGRHGQVAGQSLYGPRALVIPGTCAVDTRAAQEVARYKLAAATNLLGPTGTLVVNEVAPKQAAVMRSGNLRMKDWPGAHAFEFEAPLLAPDPRKLSTTLTTAAIAATVTNAGTFDTWPVLTVVGSAAGPIQVTKGGKTVRLNGALTGGQTLVADFATATVTINGVARNDVVDSATVWWSLAAGANVVTYSGGGTASLAFRSAWI